MKRSDRQMHLCFSQTSYTLQEVISRVNIVIAIVLSELPIPIPSARGIWTRAGHAIYWMLSQGDCNAAEALNSNSFASSHAGFSPTFIAL